MEYLQQIISYSVHNIQTYSVIWYQQFYRTRSFWITHIVADIGIHAPQNNINGCELVLEEWKMLTIIWFWCHSNVGKGT